jgi:CRISPR-associated protein Csy1
MPHNPLEIQKSQNLARLERMCSLNPNDASVWRSLGGHYAAIWQFDQARNCLERALALEPNHDECISLLGWVINEQGNTQQALSVLHPKNSNHSVTFSRLLRFALLLPQIYESREAVRLWRQRYNDGLKVISADLERFCPDPRQVITLNHTNFMLAYQGANDLDLQRQYSGMIGSLVARVRPDLVRPIRSGKCTSKIKVAFLSGFLHECTIGRYFRSWIENLDPSKFDTVVIYTGATPDNFTREIRLRVTQFVEQQANALEVANTVLSIRPDILIYPEVGMHSKNYLLASMRLAPIQCAAWGHPVTTGSDQIDYFFTCQGMEPHDGDQHYSERLLRLPGIGTQYQRPVTSIGSITREDIGLPSIGHLYFCPQSLFKIHPDNDTLFINIIEADEQAVIVFFQERTHAITISFANRLALAMSTRGIPQRKQIKFLPRTTPERFRSILALADVVLDTLHWSGGNTSLDALSVGVPIVSNPGAFMRGRQSLEMLTALGLTELIAASEDDYVKIAIRVAVDFEYNRSLRGNISANDGKVFDQKEPIRALETQLEIIYQKNLGTR